MEYLIEITAKEIDGRCPVFDVGDKWTILGPWVLKERSDAVCIHALNCLSTLTVALTKGVDFVDIGLAKEKSSDTGYFQCLDPGQKYTHGGTVLFEIRRRKIELDCINEFGIPQRIWLKEVISTNDKI